MIESESVFEHCLFFLLLISHQVIFFLKFAVIVADYLLSPIDIHKERMSKLSTAQRLQMTVTLSRSDDMQDRKHRESKHSERLHEQNEKNI